MLATKKARGANKAEFAKLLKSKRNELLVQIEGLRQGVQVERVTEDEVGQASWAQMEHLAFVTLEQGQKTLKEVEAALTRMDQGTYGICESCEQPIPEARLRALPWARYCVKCTERLRRN